MSDWSLLVCLGCGFFAVFSVVRAFLTDSPDTCRRVFRYLLITFLVAAAFFALAMLVRPVRTKPIDPRDKVSVMGEGLEMMGVDWQVKLLASSLVALIIVRARRSYLLR